MSCAAVLCASSTTSVAWSYFCCVRTGLCDRRSIRLCTLHEYKLFLQYASIHICQSMLVALLAACALFRCDISNSEVHSALILVAQDTASSISLSCSQQTIERCNIMHLEIAVSNRIIDQCQHYGGMRVCMRSHTHEVSSAAYAITHCQQSAWLVVQCLTRKPLGLASDDTHRRARSSSLLCVSCEPYIVCMCCLHRCGATLVA
jgi:hypothetical protein